MTEQPETPESLRAKVNRETSKIVWCELQRYFAAGRTVFVDNSLDLVEVAVQLSEDNKQMLGGWMAEGLVSQVTDKQATVWFEQDATLWAVVVKPWVLVQPVEY